MKINVVFPTFEGRKLKFEEGVVFIDSECKVGTTELTVGAGGLIDGYVSDSDIHRIMVESDAIVFNSPLFNQQIVQVVKEPPAAGTPSNVISVILSE